MVSQIANENADVLQMEGSSSIVLVCEHASNYIPPEFDELGLNEAARFSHIAWDPGALGVAKAMSTALDASLVAASVSRLVYDCNRPPEALDAMPEKSEAYDIPGNAGLSAAARQERVRRFYAPFHDALKTEVANKQAPVIVTIHSFTPVYNGTNRDVEIGILHDDDRRLADAMLAHAERLKVMRNAPYGPEDGVTHTLKLHGIANGHLNVMLEVRNDLIDTDTAQEHMAQLLATWVTKALADIGAATCKA